MGDHCIIIIREQGWDQGEESEAPWREIEGGTPSLRSAGQGVPAHQHLLTPAVLCAVLLHPGTGSALWDFSKFA